MKTKSSTTLLIGLLIGLVAGILTGMTLFSPGMSLMEVTGSIGRVDQYRNIRITEADIELRNELVTDQKMLEAYKSYLLFEYATNVKMADNIRNAVDAGREIPAFRTDNIMIISRMDEYGEFLDNARLRILEAIGVLGELEDRNKVAVRSVLSDAGHAISVTLVRSKPLFDFLEATEQFLADKELVAFPVLSKAHDDLFASLLAINIVNDNRPVMEYLRAKKLMTDGEELAAYDKDRLQAIIITDLEKLKLGAIKDAERLGYIEAGTMGQLQLTIGSGTTGQEGAILFDAQKLGNLQKVAEQLQTII